MDFISQNWLPLISIFIAGSSFTLSLIVYRSYAKREFLNKQIEVVTNLVEHLHSSHFDLVFTRFSGTGGAGGSGLYLTVFEVNQLAPSSQNFTEFDECELLFRSGSNQILDIKHFINNPFTPIKIADELVKFYATNYEKYKKEEFKEGEISVAVETGLFEETIFCLEKDEKNFYLKSSNSYAMLTWMNFKACCQMLENEIIYWFGNNNVAVNIRKDFLTEIKPRKKVVRAETK